MHAVMIHKIVIDKILLFKIFRYVSRKRIIIIIWNSDFQISIYYSLMNYELMIIIDFLFNLYKYPMIPFLGYLDDKYGFPLNLYRIST